ncbi:Intraflagellar transport protein 57 [Rhizophlyctis rosea]|uniref:Intraflagellar transport protein 57 n=1 Tax=Rhizophlyctis rosea TaxID=64517 RepID=A0AAD5SM25_9FUNG|nr:Intraflagellar transport protein 57 [Rhizophlyctis rosea]
MDDLLDKLKILNYQRDFCKPMNFRPLHRFYFTLPASNPNEQFYYFTSLFTWLLKLNKQDFDMPGQFDDPNATAANIGTALKTLNIPFEYGPNKLKQGYGEAIIYVLQALVDKALAASGFKFENPVHTVDDYPEEAEVDEDAEVTTEAIEEAVVADEEEEEMYMDTFPTATAVEETKSQQPPIKPKIDPAEWKLEVERVTPLLKVQIANDNKDWRIHLDQMHLHQKVGHRLMMKHHGKKINKAYDWILQTIGTSLIDTRGQLTKLHTEIEKTLEKISSREKYINTQFEPQIEEYRILQDQLSDLKQKYIVASSNVTELTNQLARTSEDLDSVKSRMDDIGSGMTDSKPLVNIRQGVAKLKGEIKQMDLRIGVIQHTLLHAKLKTKGPTGMSERSNLAQMFALV